VYAIEIYMKIHSKFDTYEIAKKREARGEEFYEKEYFVGFLYRVHGVRFHIPSYYEDMLGLSRCDPKYLSFYLHSEVETPNKFDNDFNEALWCVLEHPRV
jgi:hypothetical protein